MNESPFTTDEVEQAACLYFILLNRETEARTYRRTPTHFAIGGMHTDSPVVDRLFTKETDLAADFLARSRRTKPSHVKAPFSESSHDCAPHCLQPR